jgi:hypothetical protein
MDLPQLRSMIEAKESLMHERDEAVRKINNKQNSLPMNHKS